MILGDVFERFLAESPICVLQRVLVENVFAPSKLDQGFRSAAVRPYERALLFSTLVDLTSLVVCRVRPSVCAAYQKNRERIPVSLKALYDKLSHGEEQTARALVQHTAAAVSQLIDRMKGELPNLLPGYRVRILDGNHLSGTEHRLKVLRGTSAGAWPGQALVLLNPQRMVIEEVFPCADGHAPERSLLDQVLPTLRARDLLIADRNFCTRAFLAGLARRQARFITRPHGRMPWEPRGHARCSGRCETGRVLEPAAVRIDPETRRELVVRRLTVKLDQPTRDGDREIHLLTNLPASQVGAKRVARLYQKRGRLETAFQELTVHRRCALNTRGYPPAAWFAFGVALCCYNLLAAIQGALRRGHGAETVAEALSNYYLTEEISSTHRGLMIALPPAEWEALQTLSPEGLADLLVRWARGIDLEKYRKHPRGPKKPRARRPNAQFQHVATAKLLPPKRPLVRNSRPTPEKVSP